MIDFAASRARFRAPGVEISGFVAPLRTITPMPARWPCPGITTKSAVSPSWIRFRNYPERRERNCETMSSRALELGAEVLHDLSHSVRAKHLNLGSLAYDRLSQSKEGYECRLDQVLFVS